MGTGGGTVAPITCVVSACLYVLVFTQTFPQELDHLLVSLVPRPPPCHWPARRSVDLLWLLRVALPAPQHRTAWRERCMSVTRKVGATGPCRQQVGQGFNDTSGAEFPS